MAAGEFRSAIAPLERVKTRRPGDGAARAALIECRLKSADMQRAAEETRDLLAAGIASPAQKLRLGAMLLEAHQPQVGRPLLESALAESPGLAEAHGLLGALDLNGKAYEAAVAHFGRAAQLDPISSRYALGLAQALLDWKHNGTAVEYLKAVESRFGSLPQFQLVLGRAYFALNLNDDAARVFESLLAKPGPGADIPHYYLGRIYSAGKDFQRAEAHYKAALALNPKDPTYWLGYGVLLMEAGAERSDQAIEHLRRAAALAPSEPEPALRLAVCYMAREQFDRARPLLERVARAHPEIVRAHVLLARAYDELRLPVMAARERDLAKQHSSSDHPPIP
jgi:predicted Zn-dependent protease